jgi:hypothetical protein
VAISNLRSRNNCFAVAQLEEAGGWSKGWGRSNWARGVLGTS